MVIEKMEQFQQHGITKPNSPIQQIDQYIQLLLRRKWLIIFTAIPILILGITYCLISPPIYKTSTTIVVVPQKVPEAYVRSTVTGDNQQRIRAILEKITSRTNLEDLINRFNLYPGARKNLPMESVVEMMRAKIDIQLPQRRDSTTFILSFEGKDPVLITKVLNSIANMFIEENLRLREGQAQTTAKFLSNQLEQIYAQLKEREEALKRYKIQHMGELPEQRDANLATLNNLQQQLEGVKESIRRAQDRKLLLQQQYAQQKARLQQGLQNLTREGRAASTPGESAPASLPELQQQLSQLLTRYTENHPDVIALKQQIDRQKRAMAAAGTSPSRNRLAATGDPLLDSISFQIKNVDLEIQQLHKEAESLQKKIADYQKRIENTPKREQELIDLTRDYDNLRQTYESLLNRKIEAEQAAALERKQQGEHFSIIDPARVPAKPIKPDIKKILLATLVLAFGAGIGLAFALELLSRRFYDPEDVQSALELPVLICVPYIFTPEEIRQRRLKTALLSTAAVLGYSVVAGLLILLIRKGPGTFAGLI